MEGICLSINRTEVYLYTANILEGLGQFGALIVLGNPYHTRWCDILSTGLSACHGMYHEQRTAARIVEHSIGLTLH